MTDPTPQEKLALDVQRIAESGAFSLEGSRIYGNPFADFPDFLDVLSDSLARRSDSPPKIVIKPSLLFFWRTAICLFFGLILVATSVSIFANKSFNEAWDVNIIIVLMLVGFPFGVLMQFRQDQRRAYPEFSRRVLQARAEAETRILGICSQYRDVAHRAWHVGRERFLQESRDNARRSEFTLRQALLNESVLVRDGVLQDRSIQAILSSVSDSLTEWRAEGPDRVLTAETQSSLWVLCADLALARESPESHSPVIEGTNPASLSDSALCQEVDEMFEKYFERLCEENPPKMGDRPDLLSILGSAVNFASQIETSLIHWQAKFPSPKAIQWGISPYEVEQWVCDWMLHMGADGAMTTKGSGDGGIDIASKMFIAQVKYYSAYVPLAHVREFAGVVSFDDAGRRGLFFTSGLYTKASYEFAEKAKLALFRFDLRTASVIGMNPVAEDLVEHGLLRGVQSD